jgi:putative transposase
VTAGRLRPGGGDADGAAAAQGCRAGVGLRTIEGKRARYAAQGLWGLVDQRVTRMFEMTGQADPRLVEVIEEMLDAETGQSTGTRSRLIRRVIKRVEEIHGPGVVPLPGDTLILWWQCQRRCRPSRRIN